MGNMLSHGLLAGAAMATANLILGIEPVSWSVFLAATVAMAMGLDSGSRGPAVGSPLCHSVGCGIFIVYTAGAIAYLGWAFLGLEFSLAASAVLGVGVGVSAHLLAQALTGGHVYTLPRNLRPQTWFVECSCESTGFWHAWGRFRMKRRPLRDSHLNGVSLGILVLCIFLYGRMI